jgi:hypothetical protein
VDGSIGEAVEPCHQIAVAQGSGLQMISGAQVGLMRSNMVSSAAYPLMGARPPYSAASVFAPIELLPSFCDPQCMWTH